MKGDYPWPGICNEDAKMHIFHKEKFDENDEWYFVTKVVSDLLREKIVQ